MQSGYSMHLLQKETPRERGGRRAFLGVLLGAVGFWGEEGDCRPCISGARHFWKGFVTKV